MLIELLHYVEAHRADVRAGQGGLEHVHGMAHRGDDDLGLKP